MKFISDLFGVLLFFGTYWYTHDIFTATAAAIIATVVQVSYAWVRYRHVDRMQWVGLVLITLLGGATLFFRNKQFIMWKPTVLYALMAIALFISEYTGRNGVRMLLQAQITLPDRIWRNVCYAWAVFFFVLALLNLIVAYNFSEAVWVNFKLFGGLILMMLFIIVQGIIIARYTQEK